MYAPWTTPEITAIGRLPMHSVPHGDRLDLDGRWRFQLLPRPDGGPVAHLGRDRRSPAAGRCRGAGTSPLHERPDAVPGTCPRRCRPRTRPAVYEREVEVPGRWAGPADRAPRRGGGERPHRPRQRPRGRDRARTRISPPSSTSPSSSGPDRTRSRLTRGQVVRRHATSRTRTSGGTAESPARSSSTRPTRSISSTSAPSPALGTDLASGTLEVRAVVGFGGSAPGPAGRWRRASPT